MKHLFQIFIFIQSCSLFSQVAVTKDSFFPKNKKLTENYKTIIADTNGWKTVSHFNYRDHKIDGKIYGVGKVIKFTPFRSNSMFLKIKKKKIIAKGDRKITEKIIYVDENILILEYKLRIRSKRTKIRTIYVRQR